MWLKRNEIEDHVSAERDRQLVERAQQGDTEALGELLEQHRNKAHGWAEKLTKDPHLADDVVQDALIRAFMHIGSLSDNGRFLPWFYRIVRNQANMKLRRGGPHRKEQPFASMFTPSAYEGAVIDWEDLDSILYHLARNATDAAEQDQDPAEHLMRKEIYEWIHGLLHCLSGKERGIFRAYFFSQLSPDEIAEMFAMTTGSIYTYIHRSRQKLRKAHHRVSADFLSEKGGLAISKMSMLSLPPVQANTPPHTTFISSIGRILAALGDSRESAELMGLSSIAFRMKISNATTFADGLYVFDWRATLQRLMGHLGYEVTLLCGQLADAAVPLLRAVERFPITLRIEEAVMPFIRRHIDAGEPLLYFDTGVGNPYVHEWAVIYGYDDKSRTVQMTDPCKPDGKTIAYDHIVHNPIRFLAGFRRKGNDTAGPLNGRAAVDQVIETIRFAITYARRGCDFLPHTSYTSGLAAYDRWLYHLRTPHIRWAS
jgi:RNA polymerase sigma factor (sigma-70 family)